MQSDRAMTPHERAAYDLGIRAAIQAAQIAAITIETAPDSHTFRKQVAAETLAAFAEAAEGLKLSAQHPSKAPEVGQALSPAHCYNIDLNNAPRGAAAPQDAS